PVRASRSSRAASARASVTGSWQAPSRRPRRLAIHRGTVAREWGGSTLFVAHQHLRRSKALPNLVEKRLVAALRGPDQDDLSRFGEQEVERQQHLSQRGRRASEQGTERGDQLLGLLPVRRLAGQSLEPQQRQRRYGISGRLRAIVSGLLPRQQRLVIVRRAEESALRVREASREHLVQRARSRQPALLPVAS